MTDNSTDTTIPARRALTRAATLLAVTAGLLGSATAAWAHHSFAMFDRTKTVTIQGTVKDFQWTNPHVWIEVLVTGPDGVQKEYGIECVTVRVLKGAGWTFKTLKPGDKVTVVENPLRNGAPGGSLVSATLADGQVMSGS